MKPLCLLLFALLFSGADAIAAGQKFQLSFKNTGDLDFEYETYELPPIFKDKVGTNGSLDDIQQLTPIKKFPQNRLDLSMNETKYIGLVVKSKTQKAFDFIVAPHSTNQPTHALDFKFNCLCYHHAYHLEKNKMWYRILQLQNSGLAQATGTTIILDHEFIPWSKTSEPLSKKEEPHHHGTGSPKVDP